MHELCFQGKNYKNSGNKNSGMAIRADTAWRLWWKLSRLQGAGQREAAMERAKMNSKNSSDEQDQSSHTLAVPVFKITWRLVLSFYFQIIHNVYKLITIKFEGFVCVETHQFFFFPPVFLRLVLLQPPLASTSLCSQGRPRTPVLAFASQFYS